MLCGCTTTSTRSQGMANSQCDSMTSNPLFIRVAESMVIFLPMLHVGCLRACSGVTFSNSSSDSRRSAPPDAVMMSRRTPVSTSSPCRHCQMALGSLSTGRISPPQRAASLVSSSPAITTGSLLAIATCLPARSASSVGSSPALPTMPCITRSTSGCVAISTMSPASSVPGGRSACSGGSWQ